MMQVANYKTIGMQRDNSESAFDSRFAFENMNMRITARDNNTLLSLSNERGNTELSITPTSLLGYPLGYTILKDVIVLFTTLNVTGSTTYNTDRIYKITKADNTFTATILYEGTLHFDAEHPIECIPFYENENIQKVYWTDGKNQMRFINIASTDTYNDNSFDFVPIMDLKENVTIVKNNYGGSFPPGVIQYAFSYINNYGIETNIFHTSPLYYLSNSETGGAADSTVSNSFDITISNVDTSFDKVRVYSIVRTSINSTPVIKKIQDINTSATITLTDTNYLGETLTATSVLYTGGDKIIAGTIAQKDNTLFLGNIELVEEAVGNVLVEGSLIKDIIGLGSNYINFSAKILGSNTASAINNDSSHYPYETSRTLQYNDFDAKTFKYGEYYRFGILFQHETGKWSEAIWIADAYDDVLPTNTKLVIGNGFNVAITGSKATYTLNDSSVINKLVSLGYKNARGLIVYPSIQERRVICLGILNPTIYQIKNRHYNSPAIQSSWFLRPMIYGTASTYGSPTTASLEGGWVEFRHNRSLQGVITNGTSWEISRGAEISNFMDSNPTYNSIDVPLTPYILYNPESSVDPTRDSIEDLVDIYGDAFIVDNSSVTFNSPDIEFEGALQNIKLEQSEINILGLTHLTGFISNTSITPTTPYHSETVGFINPTIKKFNMSPNRGINVCAATPMWYDYVSGAGADYGNFTVFPWQATRPIVNRAITDAGVPTMSSKHTSNLRFSALNTYFNPVSFSNGITTPKLFTSTEESVLTIPAPANSGLADYNYLANINQIILPTKGRRTDGSYLIFRSVSNTPDANYHEDTLSATMSACDGSWYENVLIKYKSAPHAVFNFNWEADGTQVALPVFNISNRSNAGRLFYVDPTNVAESINQPYIEVPTVSTLGGGVWLADLVRPINTNTIFGGQNLTAFETNLWEVGGPITSIVDVDNTPVSEVVIEYTAGDTYIQRYDCIRTYPYNVDDVQTMTEIVSFLCETRINLDARTDNNRGKTDNRFITPLNSNLHNEVYNQRDNYFTYRGLDYELFNLNKFPNTFTWSGKKISGEITDAWANISLSNTYDVDGIYGSITALKTFNNGLIGFQDKATFEIQYNSRVQVNASDGVPIEIANSGSVDGIRYVSSASGTKNKHSIATTPFGLYYIDDTNRSINIFNGLISSLTDKLGFHSWANKSFEGLKPWSPDSFDNYVTHFDNINKDIYFVGKTETLCYSELLGQFTSFFNYEKVPYMFNAWDKFLAIKKGTTTLQLWEQNKGEYNKFFGVNKPFYTTLMVNPYPQQDKVFNTLEFRADSWETLDNWVTPNSPSTLRRTVDFTKLKVWDEYQVGELDLIFNNGIASSLKQKFRSWRTFVPRVVSKEYTALQGGIVRTPTISGLDRLRNNWAYMLLYSDGTNNYQTVLHDINVFYNL